MYATSENAIFVLGSWCPPLRLRHQLYLLPAKPCGAYVSKFEVRTQ